MFVDRWRTPFLVLLFVAPTAHAQPQTAAQQTCITGLERHVAALARAQGRRNVACVRAAATGAVDPQCLTSDPQVQAAADAVFNEALVDCPVAPDFAVPPRLAEVASAAATIHERGLVGDLFGATLGVVPVGTQGCRAAVAWQAVKLADATIRNATACELSAVRSGAADASMVAACLAGPPTGIVARAGAKLRGGVRRACRGADLPAALPGRCGNVGEDALGACVQARVRCRTCRILATAGGFDVDCDALDDGIDNDSCRMPVSLSGDILPFHLVPTGRLADATVSILEHPERQVVTGPDGHFQFDDLEENTEVTLVMSHPDYHPIQTGTIRLGPGGAERVTFQAVITPIYAALAQLLSLDPDELNACQMVTTITRVGKSMYDPGAHGEDGTVVTLHPGLPALHGPIYFNSSVLPDRALNLSSDDGGVLFVQVPPGEYVWTATKPGAAFARVKMKCRSGFLINASPPWGLQRQ